MQRLRSVVKRLSLGVTLLGASFAFASAHAADAPMKSCAGLPCVDAKLGQGATLRLMLDMGDPEAVLSLAKAKELGLTLKPAIGRDGKPGTRFSKATLQDVHVGDQDLGDVDVLVIDFKDAVAKGVFPPSDGTFGYTVFKGRKLVLDYRKQTLSLQKAAAGSECGQGCGTLSFPTFGKKGPPIVVSSGFEVNGQPVSVQVDTLYSGSMLIYPTSVDKLGLKDQATSGPPKMFNFTDGGVEMLEGKAKVESFAGRPLLKDAPLYFATPSVHLPDGLFDGTVGAELFAGHVLTLDFQNNRLWLE